MDYYKMFDDFMKNCGYDFSEYRDDNSSDNEEAPPGVADEECRCGDSDIPGGFQDLNPMLFIIIAQIIGDITASRIPFNVQNALGNWLQLIGQAILTYNAQQQYFQGGPGRIYSPIYRNAANPFCSNSSDEGQANVSSSKKKKTTSSSENKVQSSNDINELKKSISELSKQIKELQSEIENLKKK